MENKNNSNLNGTQVDVVEMNKKIEEKTRDQLNPSEMKKMFSELNDETDSKVDNVLGDLFYQSVKLIFDTGFDLAKKLNLDLFESFEFDKKKDKNKT